MWTSVFNSFLLLPHDQYAMLTELLLVYLSLTFWEWVLHSQVMHGDPDALRRVPVIGAQLAQVAKDHISHHMDVNIDMTLKGNSHKSGLFFSWQTTFVGTALVFVTLVTLRVDMHTAIRMAVAAALLMSVLWNSWHADMHGSDLWVGVSEGIPRVSGLSRGPLYQFLWKYHAIHHSQKGQKFNFNIIFPGFDFLAGTYQGNCFDNDKYCAQNGQDDRCAQGTRYCYTNTDVLAGKTSHTSLHNNN